MPRRRKVKNLQSVSDQQGLSTSESVSFSHTSEVPGCPLEVYIGGEVPPRCPAVDGILTRRLLRTAKVETEKDLGPRRLRCRPTWDSWCGQGLGHGFGQLLEKPR
jgi:hypothetical protein